MPSPTTVISLLLPILPIMISISYHFLLLCFVLVFNWLPYAYIFSHFFLIAVGLWAVHAKTEILPVIAYVGIVLISILLDIIQLGLYFPGNQDLHGSGSTTEDRTWQFSAAMCIINLLLKPLTAALACIAVFFRAGGTIKGIGGGGQDSYSDLHGSEQNTPE